MKINFVLFIVLLLIGFSCKYINNDFDSVRMSKIINTDWTFNYFPQETYDSTFADINFDDSQWQAVAIPHTWSTYETTNEIHPFIYNASENDDPYWWHGWGCYKKRFSIDKSLKNKKVFIEFDGVQKYSKIYLNGKYLGDHKGGFTGFYFDLTEHLNWDEKNILTVFVNNRRNDENKIPPMSAGNWNIYGGIYRDVRLVVKERIYIPFQGSYKHEGGTFVTTPRVTKKSADVKVATWVRNDTEVTKTVELQTYIANPEKEIIAKFSENKKISSKRTEEFTHFFENISNPLLWSPDTPNLYTVFSKVLVDGKISDEYTSPLGFRYFYWDYENDNLYVNGEKINILGTNRHQEYPWLGDACPKWIARTDMLDIKENLGHNFMRLAHYPNDKYLYQLADSLGIIIVEEVPNIKSLDFSDEVQEQNVREMIRRDRNHPSIFFWSMGNETTKAADSKWAVEEDITRIIHLRKGEQGGDFVEHTHENLDMENLLRVTTRGWFNEDDAPKGFNSSPENGQHASNESWQHKMAMETGGSVRGLLGDNCVAWLYQDHGADREYLNCTLKNFNPKGWVDIYRQPKYIYWLTKAFYTDNPTVFIQPHFWRTKYIGQKRDIIINSNCDEIELLVNEKSLGKKYPSEKDFNTVVYKDVTVENGCLKAVGIKDGERYVNELKMPGEPSKIVLTTNQEIITADRTGISIVFANILDKDDNPVFDATNTLKWSVSGEGRLIGPEVYETDILKHEEKEGSGYTVVPVANLIRSTNIAGVIKVKVSSDGLEPGEITIHSIDNNDKVKWLEEPKLDDNGRDKVIRNKDYTWDMKIIPLTILPLRENHFFEDTTTENLLPAIKQFISNRNFGNFNKFIAYKFLIDKIEKNIIRMNGHLIADDYNFYINKFNSLVVIEDYIDKNIKPSFDKTKLKEEISIEFLINDKAVDVQKIIERIKLS